MLFRSNRRQGGIYEVTFRAVLDGFQLVSKVAPIRLRFTDRGVVYYHRHVYLHANSAAATQPILSPSEALQALLASLGSEADNRDLAAMYPAYYLENASTPYVTAQPVWIFVLGEQRKAVIHAHTGKFMAWLE